MERRTIFKMVGIGLSTPFAGCLSSAPTNNEEHTDESGDDMAGVEIEFIEEKEDASDSKSEQVLLRNNSDENQRISGYTLTYSSGYEYTFSGGLSLEPGARVAVVSQGTGDHVAESDPPKYYRDADLPELVFEDGKETVRLLNQNDEVVVEASFNAQ